MIDVSKPIRTKNTCHGAMHHGMRADGSHVVSWNPDGDARWYTGAFSQRGLELDFENVPVKRPKLTGFCAVVQRGNSIWVTTSDDKLSSASFLGVIGLIDLSKIPPEAIEWVDR